MRASLLFRWISTALLAIGPVLHAETPPIPLLPEVPRRKPLAQAATATPLAQPAAAPTAATPASATPVVFNPDALAWENKALKLQAKEGQQSIDFKFVFTNVSTKPVVISGTHTSCGCTVTRLPQTPWTIAAKEAGEIAGSMNLLGKSGTVTKTVNVMMDGGSINLAVTVDIPKPDLTKMREADRQKNMSIATADRQAVFRGECASCHVTPTIGKRGHELYTAACGICHDAPNKASMVPALRELKHPTDYDFWLTWVRNGKPNSLMPAFDLKQGGILDQAQIESLAEYLDSPEFAKRTIRGNLPLEPQAK